MSSDFPPRERARVLPGRWLRPGDLDDLDDGSLYPERHAVRHRPRARDEDGGPRGGRAQQKPRRRKERYPPGD